MIEISSQIQDLASQFTEEASSLTDVITGAAIGAVAGFLLGPIGWIGLGLYAAWNFFFGEEETEEQKREKAKHKALNKEERQRVYNEFDSNWDNICSQIHNSIDSAINNNSDVRRKVNNQCKKVLQDYADECLRQTRLMLD